MSERQGGTGRLPLVLYLALGALIVGLSRGGVLTAYVQLIIMFIGINIILTASLNLINGYMGEFSCGHAGFMAVGAYVTSVLNVWLFAQDRVFGLRGCDSSFELRAAQAHCQPAGGDIQPQSGLVVDELGGAVFHFGQ